MKLIVSTFLVYKVKKCLLKSGKVTLVPFIKKLGTFYEMYHAYHGIFLFEVVSFCQMYHAKVVSFRQMYHAEVVSFRQMYHAEVVSFAL